MNVELLTTIYGKSLKENEKNVLFWENYLQNLETLDLKAYTEKLTVPILVPIGSRVLFRGELKHTNEVTVALGADYFTKCSVNQAEVLKQHRIKDAKSKLESLKKEREYLESHIQFSKNSVLDDAGNDIIEVVTDEEDKNWRKQHRENVRKYKQRKDKKDEEKGNEFTDEDIWDRLEELELQEELENELGKDNIPDQKTEGVNRDSDDDDDDDDIHLEKPCNKDDLCNAVDNEENLTHFSNRRNILSQPSKSNNLELVLERHKVLKEKVAELRIKERKKSKTEDDLVERIDAMVKLDELEDEIFILEDMLASDDFDEMLYDDKETKEEDSNDAQPKKSVAFADEDDSETFEITFKHSDVEPSNAPYDLQKGITKPSDIHKAYPCCFNGETTSILKKTKYDTSPLEVKDKEQVEESSEVKVDSNLTSTIVVGDVVEKIICNENNVNQNERPMSLFKKRRQQSKEIKH